MSDVLDTWHNAPNPDELRKAIKESKSELIMPKSAIIDPLQTAYNGGTRTKPTPIPYSTLRRMAQIPAIAAVINTRLNQVANHAKRPKFQGDKGFKIALKDRDAKMSDSQRKRAREIEDFFLKTGWKKNRIRKDNFNQFLRKITRDTLTLDVMSFEKVSKVKGALRGRMDVAEMWAVDVSTIELVVTNPTGEGNDFEIPVYKPETKTGMTNIGEIAYVQKVNGTVTAEFTEDELAFAIRNPRTDLDYTDFGMSELETLIEIVTGIVNGVRYNTSYFSSSSLPQGVLGLVGKYDDKQLEAFKRHWRTMTDGAAGKWSVPVMAVQDGAGFQWTPFKNSNRDMEFNQFLEFLFNIACAVYQIDPNEVGFKSWTSDSGGMTKSDNTAEKNEMSKDKGFVPLMTFLSDTFNSEIVDLIDDEFEFQWIGVDDDDEDKKLERQKTQIEAGIKTVSMIWAENDADVEDLKAQNGGKLPDWAYAPANAQLIQVYTAGMQAQQQQDQMKQQGDMEQQKAQQDQQFQQQTADDQHKKQLEVMDKQHQQSMQAKAIDHLHDRTQAANQQANDKDMQKGDQKHQVNMQKMTHEQEQAKQKLDQAHQTALQKMQEQHADKQQSNDHSHQKELTELQGKQADKQQGNDHKHQMGVVDRNAEHAANAKVADQQHQVAMAEMSHKTASESKKVDHAHQKEMAKITAEQKAKKEKLKKSIADDFKAAGFDIDWGDY